MKRTSHKAASTCAVILFTTMSATLADNTAENLRILSKQSFEEQLSTLNSLAPEAIASLPVVFKVAALSSINRMLDRRNAGILLVLLRGTDLGDQWAVFAALDRFAYRRTAVLKRAISTEFQSRVRNMVKKAIEKQSDSGTRRS
jgi:hypothetical protein